MKIQPHAGFKLTPEEKDGSDIILNPKTCLLGYIANADCKLTNLDYTVKDSRGRTFRIKIKPQKDGTNYVDIQEKKTTLMELFYNGIKQSCGLSHKTNDSRQEENKSIQ